MQHILCIHSTQLRRCRARVASIRYNPGHFPIMVAAQGRCDFDDSGMQVLRLISRYSTTVWVLAVLWLLAGSVRAQKTDIITLVNGDRITCELKELERGLLRVKTDSAGTLYVEWQDIVSIVSDKHYSVETASGVLAFGSLRSSADHTGIDVSYADRTVRLKKSAVVDIQSVKDTFLSRMDGSIALGFSFKKANNDLQLNFSANASYQSRRHSYSGSLTALVSSQDSSAATERYVGNFGHRAYIKPKWSSLASGELEQNTELDLKLRTLIMGGGDYQYFKTNRTSLDSATGLALNNERYFSVDKASRTSLEWFVSAGYEFFKFNTPKADVSARFTVFPSLTEKGRIRTNLTADLRWEIIKDLSWVISVYSSTDNQPPESTDAEDAEEASGTDYGVITSVEWTF
jgi:hypothetical protein